MLSKRGLPWIDVHSHISGLRHPTGRQNWGCGLWNPRIIRIRILAEHLVVVVVVSCCFPKLVVFFLNVLLPKLFFGYFWYGFQHFGILPAHVTAFRGRRFERTLPASCTSAPWSTSTLEIRRRGCGVGSQWVLGCELSIWQYIWIYLSFNYCIIILYIQSFRYFWIYLVYHLIYHDIPYHNIPDSLFLFDMTHNASWCAVKNKLRCLNMMCSRNVKIYRTKNK